MVSRKLQNEFKSWRLHDMRRYSSPPWHFEDGRSSMAGKSMKLACRVLPSIVKYGKHEYDDARDGSALLPVGPIYAADLSQPVSFARKLIKLQKVPTNVVQLSRAKLMQNMQMRSCHAKKN